MGKTILITGASSGLGEGMARLFAARGNDLGLCARRTDRLSALQSELQQNAPGVRVAVKRLDVTDHPSVFEVFRGFAEELGRLDRVIVNAGMGKGAAIGTGYFRANKQTAAGRSDGAGVAVEGHRVCQLGTAAARRAKAHVTRPGRR